MSVIAALPQIRDEGGKFKVTEEPKTFNQWLDLIKVRYGLKYDQDLSQKINVSISAISQIYANKRYPSALNTQRILDSLGIKEGTKEYFLVLKLVHKARYEGESKSKKVRRS